MHATSDGIRRQSRDIKLITIGADDTLTSRTGHTIRVGEFPV